MALVMPYPSKMLTMYLYFTNTKYLICMIRYKYDSDFTDILS